MNIRVPATGLNVAGMLERHHAEYESGQGIHALYAVQICAKYGEPIPTWVAIAIDEAMMGFWSESHPRGFDRAFNATLDGAPVASAGKRAIAQRRASILKRKIYFEASALVAEGQSLDIALKSVIANHKIPMGLTKTRALYEEQASVQIAALRAAGFR